MPRITLYVSDILKARMDQVDNVNWSSVAQRAFERELNIREAQKEVGTMNDVIDRLRASKQEHEKGVYEQGQTAGYKWARTAAEYPQLVSLRSARQQRSFHDETFNVEDLFGAVIESPPTTPEKTEFLEAAAGAEIEPSNISDEYAKGFADGAITLLEEVKDRL